MRVKRSRGVRVAAWMACAGLAVVIALAIGLWRFGEQGEGPPSAIIIDQLAATDPHPVFVDGARAELQAAGYTVDYVPWFNVTVDLYRDLPLIGYDLIILRSHSSGELLVNVADEAGIPAESRASVASVQLFTNETYFAEAHTAEQRGLALSRMTYTAEPGDDRAFFGIMPRFVRDFMKGDFDGAVVLLMGCDGLTTTDLADAFLDRGASNFVSWNGQVTASHTDDMAGAFLREYARGAAVDDAVATAMRTTGADPDFASRLAARSR